MEAGFRLWLEATGKARSTIHNYIVGAGIWLSWCEANEVDYFHPSREDVRAYFGEMLTRLERSTVALRHSAMRIFYGYLLEESLYLGPNPATWVSLRKVDPPPVEPFTQDELQRMCAACKTHQERAVFLLLTCAGLRRGEIYSITRADINQDTRTIRVDGKRGVRHVRPGATVVTAVLAALEFTERLCPQSSNDVVARIAKRLADRAGIHGRFNPHRFRHSYAVHFLDQGGTEGELMHVLGHRRLDQSLFYARAAESRRALERQEMLDMARQLLGLGA